MTKKDLKRVIEQWKEMKENWECKLQNTGISSQKYDMIIRHIRDISRHIEMLQDTLVNF